MPISEYTVQLILQTTPQKMNQFLTWICHCYEVEIVAISTITSIIAIISHTNYFTTIAK